VGKPQQRHAFLPDSEDFDRYCESMSISLDDEPVAFAAWLNTIAADDDIQL